MIFDRPRRRLGWAPTIFPTSAEPASSGPVITTNFVEITPEERATVTAENKARAVAEAAAARLGVPVPAVLAAGAAVVLGAGWLVWKKFSRRSKRRR